MGQELSTNASFSIAGKQVHVVKKIAEGGYSFVYLVEDSHRHGQFYALKRCVAGDREQEALVNAEIEIMRTVCTPAHPYLVPFHGFLKRPSPGGGNGNVEYCVLMENCSRGSVINEMQGLMDRRMRLHETKAFVIFEAALRGVKALHDQSPPIAHRDIKIENILIGDDGRYKLCDFGSCRPAAAPVDLSSPAVFRAEQDIIARHSTEMYRAPEMCDLYRARSQGWPINEKVDIWALGCVLFMLTFFKHPFEDGGVLGILSGRLDFPSRSGYSKYAAYIISKCFTMDPRARPSAAEVLDLCQSWRVFLATKGARHGNEAVGAELEDFVPGVISASGASFSSSSSASASASAAAASAASATAPAASRTAAARPPPITTTAATGTAATASHSRPAASAAGQGSRAAAAAGARAGAGTRAGVGAGVGAGGAGDAFDVAWSDDDNNDSDDNDHAHSNSNSPFPTASTTAAATASASASVHAPVHRVSGSGISGGISPHLHPQASPSPKLPGSGSGRSRLRAQQLASAAHPGAGAGAANTGAGAAAAGQSPLWDFPAPPADSRPSSRVPMPKEDIAAAAAAYQRRTSLTGSTAAAAAAAAAATASGSSGASGVPHQTGMSPLQQHRSLQQQQRSGHFAPAPARAPVADLDDDVWGSFQSATASAAGAGDPFASAPTSPPVPAVGVSSTAAPSAHHAPAPSRAPAPAAGFAQVPSFAPPSLTAPSLAPPSGPATPARSHASPALSPAPSAAHRFDSVTAGGGGGGGGGGVVLGLEVPPSLAPPPGSVGGSPTPSSRAHRRLGSGHTSAASTLSRAQAAQLSQQQQRLHSAGVGAGPDLGGGVTASAGLGMGMGMGEGSGAGAGSSFSAAQSRVAARGKQSASAGAYVLRAQQQQQQGQQQGQSFLSPPPMGGASTSAHGRAPAAHEPEPEHAAAETTPSLLDLLGGPDNSSARLGGHGHQSSDAVLDYGLFEGSSPAAAAAAPARVTHTATHTVAVDISGGGGVSPYDKLVAASGSNRRQHEQPDFFSGQF